MKDKLPFYSHHAQELEGTTGEKIRRLVEEELIEYSSADKCFYIHPIKGYNTRTYRIVPDREFGHRCNCQAFVTREKKFREGGQASAIPRCSHVAAVYEWFARMHRGIKQAKITAGIQTTFG